MDLIQGKNHDFGRDRKKLICSKTSETPRTCIIIRRGITGLKSTPELSSDLMIHGSQKESHSWTTKAMSRRLCQRYNKVPVQIRTRMRL